MTCVSRLTAAIGPAYQQCIPPGQFGWAFIQKDAAQDMCLFLLVREGDFRGTANASYCSESVAFELYSRLLSGFMSQCVMPVIQLSCSREN